MYLWFCKKRRREPYSSNLNAMALDKRSSDLCSQYFIVDSISVDYIFLNVIMQQCSEVHLLLLKRYETMSTSDDLQHFLDSLNYPFCVLSYWKIIRDVT